MRVGRHHEVSTGAPGGQAEDTSRTVFMDTVSCCLKQRLTAVSKTGEHCAGRSHRKLFSTTSMVIVWPSGDLEAQDIEIASALCD